MEKRVITREWHCVTSEDNPDFLDRVRISKKGDFMLLLWRHSGLCANKGIYAVIVTQGHKM